MNQMPEKVSIIIPGASRSGTTSLYKHLENHRDICFSKIKEIHYFSVEDLYARGKDYYHSFFLPKPGEKLLAAADTYLFIDKKAPQRIKKYNPGMKFIIMLREPVDRAWSGYRYAINNGYEDAGTSFSEAFKKENERLEQLNIAGINNLCNVYQSRYHHHISHWMAYFKKEQFLLIKTQELNSNPAKVLHNITEFAGISKFTNDIEPVKVNQAAGVKSKKLQQFLLNRDTFGRKAIRKLVPSTVKNKIAGSGIVDKMHAANKQQTFNIAINENDRNIVEKYLEEDIRKLKNEFNIVF